MHVVWIPTTPEIYAAIYRQHKDGASVFASCTDLDGRFGDPRIETVWGFQGADCGLIRSVGTEPQGQYHEMSKWEYYLAAVVADPGDEV